MENSDKVGKAVKNNIYRFDDLKKIFMGDASIELKYETIAVIVGLIVAIITFINNIIFYTSKYMLIHSFIIVLAIPVVFIVSSRLFVDVDAYIARRLLAILGPPCMACVWFISGGYTYLTGIIWMIYAVAFNSLVISDRKSKYYALYAIVVNLICLIVVDLNPQLIIPLDRPEMIKVQNLVNVIVICAFFYETVKLQMSIAAMERNKLIEKEAEVTSIYEEVIATNEDLRNANEMLAKLNEQIEQQMETQTRFTSSMNHELRAPLNAVIGTLQILKINDNLNAEEKTSVDVALSSGRLMLQIVNDLLDFAKLREGKFEIIPSDFELEKLIENIWGSFYHQAKAKNLDFTIDVEDGTYTRLKADDVRIEQILNNLLSNAIKYTDDGSVKLSISNASINDKAAIKLSVRDTGQGMETNSIDEIAKPFARFNLQKNKNVQGTGLGMNIVRLLINQMGGTIACETAINVGTEFTVIIPVRVNAEEAYYNNQGAIVDKKDSNSDYSKLKFLCVDDTAINHNVFKGLLKKTGANIDMALSGFEAIEKVQKEQYDIIFIDHMMPDMDGIETHKKLVEILGDNQPEYVMLTGNTGDDYRNLYRQEGFKYIVEKPILKNRLIDMIDNILKSHN